MEEHEKWALYNTIGCCIIFARRPMKLLFGHRLLQRWNCKALGPALLQIPAPNNPLPWFSSVPTTFVGCRPPAAHRP